MKEYVCKCGSKRIFIRDNGTQTGIYCKECGKWIGKKEIPFAEEYIKEQNKNDNSNTNKIDEVKKFIMDILDEYRNVVSLESIYDLVDKTNKKFDTDIKCEHVCGFKSLSYSVDYYVLAGIVEGELFFHIVEL